VFFAKRLLHQHDIQVGVVVMAGGAGGILAALCTPTLGRRLLEPTLMVYGCGGTMLGVGSIGLAHSALTLSTANFISGFASVVAVIAIRTLRQRLVPRELLGRTTGTARMIALSAGPLGTLLAGALTSANGGDPRPVFLGAGALGLVSVVSIWATFLRRVPLPVTTTTLNA
jgi:Na+/melibiose symporter-like transporter